MRSCFTANGVKLADGSPLYTLGSTMFFRGDGGFGGQSERAPVPHTLPDREPDAVCEMPGPIDQAMAYALCGDRNPLHCDPEFARKAGFDVRFCSPVFSGETQIVEMWKDGSVVSFRVRIKERTSFPSTTASASSSNCTQAFRCSGSEGVKYRPLGNSGLRVSELALGAMTFGTERSIGVGKAESGRIYHDRTVKEP